MNHTKDEIEIKVTKKDRFYLSIILSLICVVAVVCILVPRYYQLQNQNPSAPTTSDTSQKGDLTDSSENTPSDESSGEQTTSINQAYKNYYSTLVINTLKSVGMPYSTLSHHLDTSNILDVAGIGISTAELTNLEYLSQPIYTMLTNYINSGTAITTSLINSDNALYSQIVAFSNALNALAE